MKLRGRLVVFAKAPRVGAVKTRLCPPLSAEQATELYAAMLEDVLEATAAFAPALGLEPVLAVHPASACSQLAHRAPTPFRVVRQRGVSLAERMDWAVREGAAAGAACVLLRGSDSPTLGAADVAAVLEALGQHDLAVQPDRDGGYTLVGVARPVQGLFDHPMSTPRVLDETLARARSRGLDAALAPAGFDIDRIGDLRWLAHARAEGRAGGCPRTLAWIDRAEAWNFVGLA